MKPMQCGKPERSGTKRVCKRRSARLRRRLEKRDPENAPTKNAYHEYTR